MTHLLNCRWYLHYLSGGCPSTFTQAELKGSTIHDVGFAIPLTPPCWLERHSSPIHAECWFSPPLLDSCGFYHWSLVASSSMDCWSCFSLYNVEITVYCCVSSMLHWLLFHRGIMVVIAFPAMCFSCVLLPSRTDWESVLFLFFGLCIFLQPLQWRLCAVGSELLVGC